MRHVSLSTRRLGASTEMFVLSPHPSPPVLVRPEAAITRARSWWAPASCDLGGLQAFRVFRTLALRADLLHFHYPWPFGDLLHLLGRVDRAAVVTYHSDVVRQQLFDRLYGPLRRRFLGSVQAVIATSPPYALSSPVLRSLAGERRVVTIPLGLEESTVPGSADGDDEVELGPLLDRVGQRPFFLFVGVLRYYKGLPHLIEAARRTGRHVVIVGDGPMRDEWRALADDLPNVHFTGQVSEAVKYQLIRRSLAMVLPSHLRSEAFGVSLIESSLCGVPMISCEIGTGTSYVNLHEVTGLVVPPEDPASLAEAMERLAGDEALRDRFGRQARLRYEQLFSGDALGRSTLRLYGDVLAGRPFPDGGG